MNKFAEEQIKLAYLTGSASALRQFGFSPQTIHASLMEKGASYDEASSLMKEAGPIVAAGRGLVTIGTKALPAIGRFFSRLFRPRGKAVNSLLQSGGKGSKMRMIFNPNSADSLAYRASNLGKDPKAVNLSARMNALRSFGVDPMRVPPRPKGFGGWAQDLSNEAGGAFTRAGKGLQTDPGKTFGKGIRNFGGGMIGRGEGLGGGLGSATTLGLVGAGLFGGSSPSPEDGTM